MCGRTESSNRTAEHQTLFITLKHSIISQSSIHSMHIFFSSHWMKNDGQIQMRISVKMVKIVFFRSFVFPLHFSRPFGNISRRGIAHVIMDLSITRLHVHAREVLGVAITTNFSFYQTKLPASEFSTLYLFGMHVDTRHRFHYHGWNMQKWANSEHSDCNGIHTFPLGYYHSLNKSPADCLSFFSPLKRWTFDWNGYNYSIFRI